MRRWLASVRVRLVSLYRSARGLRYWIAHSPAGKVDLGWLTDSQALAAGSKLGAVAYIDRAACIVFYNVIPTK